MLTQEIVNTFIRENEKQTKQLEKEMRELAERQCSHVKTCEDCLLLPNCIDARDFARYRRVFGKNPCEIYKQRKWTPIPCRCGGRLSEIRLHDGKAYRHCYSCHFDFYFEKGE